MYRQTVHTYQALPSLPVAAASSFSFSILDMELLHLWIYETGATIGGSESIRKAFIGDSLGHPFALCVEVFFSRTMLI